MLWVGALNMDRIRSRRKVILTGAFTQALTLVPIGLLPFLFGMGSPAIFYLLALLTAYHGANGLVIPVWNSLIGDLVPPEIRGRFFGHRNLIFRVSHIRPIAGATFSLFTGLFRQGRDARKEAEKEQKPPSSNTLL
jgi:MFS family permease